MFDRPGGGDVVVLVSLNFGEPDYAESLQELKQLAISAGLQVRATIEGRRSRPDAKYFVGSGKADELSSAIQLTESRMAVFNHDLSPSQQRNLEDFLKCRVLDRTGLILDIFAQRAQSHEGKLQIELAQLEHLSTRLVRGWTHLERQKGGIGVRGGPGEKQLELDRRMLRVRIKGLREKLDKLKRTRGMQRRSRKRSQVMSVSLVGYTNAGKSTLFNQLTRSGAYVANQLFATLDTTSRKLFIPECGQIVLSDTVGFIKRLPHALVEAFGATLEESAQADLLLHVVDAASNNRDEQILQVNRVLEEISAAQVSQILVLNQIDRLGLEAGLERDEYGRISKVRVSAKTGAGLDLMRQAMLEHQQFLLEKKVAEKPTESLAEAGVVA
jgi:GTPase